MLSSLDLPETNPYPPSLSWLQLRSRPTLSSPSVYLSCVLLPALFVIALVRGPLNLRLFWCAHVDDSLYLVIRICRWCEGPPSPFDGFDVVISISWRRQLPDCLSALVQSTRVSAVRCPGVATAPYVSDRRHPVLHGWTPRQQRRRCPARLCVIFCMYPNAPVLQLAVPWPDLPRPLSDLLHTPHYTCYTSPLLRTANQV
ncbi:hypothetical protein SAMN05216388_10892 [Halorientalis persicus]|uniref:Uncharacterized protein n=1 Tax=Halorientalis persicus TaxID=1367881 RepID=A0A1H8WYE3_9EURY|nr:hypothetical protein SAMN05216388_10892 [Halorientalis persicus]